MQGWRRDCVLFVSLLCLITLTHSATVGGGGRRRRSPVAIPVGVILDLDSSLGDMVLNFTNIALQDFYSTDDYYYSTYLQLHFRHSGNDLLAAASAARDLINNKKVHAILGPQNSEQAMFIVELGIKSHVPVIWFSPSGPSLLPPRSRFFINSDSASHCAQFEAIAAIIEAYNWRSVIPIYEDPEFGNDLIPCLFYALQDMDTRLPYISAINQHSTDDEIKAELIKNIKPHRTYVFLAHMSVELWSRLVKSAKDAGMMSEGYAWILTQGLSSVIDPKARDIKVKGYMNGSLGVRPSWIVYDANINKLVSLARNLSEYDKSLSLYGLWAYDTITALANAVEKAGIVHYSTVSYRNGSRVEVTEIGMRSETGPILRGAILDTDFLGLSGNFSLKQEQLEPSEFVVYNVEGRREKTIGYWRPETGLFQNYSADREPVDKYKLRDPIWPGNTAERPPKLKIGVPKTHFTEFVNVTVEEQDTLATGFAVDVFQKVVHVLPFNLTYEFAPVKSPKGQLTPWSYDDLLCDITNKGFDAIIGDITIVVGRRTECVDFTMPYLDSSVSMVVQVGSDSKNKWILLEPFDLLLWLILGAIFVGATIIVIVLERRKKKNDDDESKRENNDGSKWEEFVRNPFLIYASDVEILKSGTSKWVVIVVTFLLGLAVQVYTANLTSIFSERITAKPSPEKDVQELRRNNRFVGYQSDSWVKDLLINQIGLKDECLKGLRREEYNDALSKGHKEGGVEAIFDETPYLRLFLSNCDSCKMTGPIYKAGGFAFAFPKNSTLVSNFSAAILQVTQDAKLFRDMKEKIGLPVNIDKSEYESDVEMRSLTKDDFGGLFPIVYFVLVLFFTLAILKVTSIFAWFHNKFVSFLSPSGGVISIKK